MSSPVSKWNLNSQCSSRALLSFELLKLRTTQRSVKVSPTGGLTCHQRSTVGRPPTVDLELSTTNSHNHPKALTMKSTVDVTPRKSAPIQQFFTIDPIGSDNSFKKLKNQTDWITKKKLDSKGLLFDKS